MLLPAADIGCSLLHILLKLGPGGHEFLAVEEVAPPLGTAQQHRQAATMVAACRLGPLASRGPAILSERLPVACGLTCCLCCTQRL